MEDLEESEDDSVVITPQKPEELGTWREESTPGGVHLKLVWDVKNQDPILMESPLRDVRRNLWSEENKNQDPKLVESPLRDVRRNLSSEENKNQDPKLVESPLRDVRRNLSSEEIIS